MGQSLIRWICLYRLQKHVDCRRPAWTDNPSSTRRQKLKQPWCSASEVGLRFCPLLPSKHDTLKQCCFNVGPSVCDAGPTLNQHCFNVACLLDMSFWCFLVCQTNRTQPNLSARRVTRSLIKVRRPACDGFEGKHLS